MTEIGAAFNLKKAPVGTFSLLIVKLQTLRRFVSSTVIKTVTEAAEVKG